MKTIGELLPKCPRKTAHLPVDQVYAQRTRHPELWGACLMACIASQRAILTELWTTDYQSDSDLDHVIRCAAEYGFFPTLMRGPTDKAASELFRLAYACTEKAN